MYISKYQTNVQNVLILPELDRTDACLCAATDKQTMLVYKNRETKGGDNVTRLNNALFSLHIANTLSNY